MINIFDLREQDCQVTRVDYDGGIDVLIERPNGDVIHLMMTQAQAAELEVSA